MIVGVALIVDVMLLDYLTGGEISFSIFYLIPISLIAWFVGRKAGIFMSVLGAILWLSADLLVGHAYSHPAIPYWNMLVRLGFFLIVTLTLSALRAAQARQEELGHFIVHDLRSPLSNVMIGLQTLQDIVGETGDAIQGELVDTCLVSCQRMLTLINSLLDLARLESGKMPLQLEQTQVDALIGSSLRQVSAWAAQDHIVLQSQLDADAGTVYADPSITERVLVNLLSNAIKFSPSGSTVLVRAALTGEDEVALSVVDQGRGIPQEWAARIFDKFAQVKARKAGGGVGSGLGLSFCRYAVEAQGGRIWMESAVEKGTTMTFTLPRHAARRLAPREGG